MPLFRPNFNFKNDGLPAERDPFRHLSRIVKPGMAQCREAGMKDGGTTVVMLPAPDFQAPDYKTRFSVLPDRYSEEPGDYSSWVFKADGIRRFGKNPISLLFDDPDPSTGFDRYVDNPAYAIYNTLHDVIRGGITVDTPFGSSASDNWLAILKGESKPGQKAKYPDVTRPGELYMTYAAVWSHGKDNYAAMGAPVGASPDDLPVVFVQSLNTFQGFYAEIEKRNQDQSLMVPDITGAKFVHFYDKQGSCPAMQAALQAQASQMTSFGSRQRGGTAATGFQPGQAGGRDLAGYGVYLSDTPSGRPVPSDNPINREIFVRLAVSKVKPWEDVLRGFTPDETAREIATHAGLPMSILYHCWKHKPEWYSEEMRTALRNPSSIVVNTPAAAAAGAWAQAYGQPTQGQDHGQGQAGPETYPLGSLPWDGGHTQAQPPAAPANAQPSRQFGTSSFNPPPAFDPGQTQPPAAQVDPQSVAVNQDDVARHTQMFRQRMANRQQPGGSVDRSNAGR